MNTQTCINVVLNNLQTDTESFDQKHAIPPIPKVKTLIMQNGLLLFQSDILFDYNYWCINVFITLMLQLVKLELILVTSYTAGIFILTNNNT